jgi:PKD repeat protein
VTVAPANQPPVAAFTSSCTQLACNFTSTSSDPDGTIASYAWTFGDGGTAATQNPSHTYATGGTYTVTLTVTDNRGATNNISHTVTVAPANQPPVAAFTSSCTQLACNFTSTSTDPDGSIASYAWTFGDAGTATTQNPSHTYTAGGTFTVTLTVTDNQGATNNISHTVTVAPPNQPPTAAFSSSCTLLVCTFTSTSSDPDGSITSYRWTFGDGGTGTEQSPTHVYTAPGTYTVTLTVTDNQGATDNVSHTVSVAAAPPNQPPSATAGGDETVLVGALFTLTGASFSDPDHDGPWTVTIDWGDGTSSTSTASSEGSIGGSHSYPVTLLGHDYQLTVTVVDAHGARGSATKTVHVVLL